MRYGDANTTEPEGWLLVARPGCAKRGLVHVEFVVDPTDPALADIVTGMTKEIELYIDLREPDPRAYAKCLEAVHQ